MIMEGLCVFGVPAIANSNTATVSTNVFDAGAAVKLFGNRGSDLKVVGHAVCTADDNPTLLVELIGADAASLATNPMVLGSTGIMIEGPDGATAWASGADIPFSFKCNRQYVAKRYYGLRFTLGGTNPDCAADASGAALVIDDQSNDYRAAAATP
jgi:hypothetical protein